MAGDFGSAILEHVLDAPCEDASLVCSLRWALDYLMGSVLLLAGCVVLGFVAALSIAVFMARSESRATHRPLRKRLLSGPLHTDGAWIRLVEDEHGQRIVEVLEGATWRPSSRDLSHLLDVPVTLQPRA